MAIAADARMCRVAVSTRSGAESMPRKLRTLTSLVGGAVGVGAAELLARSRRWSGCLARSVGRCGVGRARRVDQEAQLERVNAHPILGVEQRCIGDGDRQAVRG